MDKKETINQIACEIIGMMGAKLEDLPEPYKTRNLDAARRIYERIIEPLLSDNAKTGCSLITAERKRQIEVEGWTAEHDSDWNHSHTELACAAGCYALDYHSKNRRPVSKRGIDAMIGDLWPWDVKWWKPTPDDPVRQLVKAGALIAAEIDRIQRAAQESSKC